MLGFAYQLGALPLSAEAIEQAIELNGEAVAMNLAAFRWGRRAAHEPDAVEKLAAPHGASTDARSLSQSLDEIVARRVAFLTAYQNAGLCGALPRAGRAGARRPRPSALPASAGSPRRSRAICSS